MKAAPLDNTKTAYAYIRNRILDRVYLPGERLTGQEIAEALGLSRTPVREALGQLELNGLVEKTGWGFAVRTMTLQEIEDLFDARELLEIDASRKAFHSAHDAWLKTLHEILTISETHLRADRPVASIRAARELHVSISHQAGNQVLSNMLASINDQIQLVGGALVSQFPWRATEVLKENQEIVAAFEERALESLLTAVRNHIRRSRELHLANKSSIRAA